MSNDIADFIRGQALDCLRCARINGFEGSLRFFTLTDLDCQSITDLVEQEHGRMPTYDEWEAAGWPDVGSKHYVG